MNIRAVDLEMLNRKLVKELAEGKIWALYEPGTVYSDVEKIQFFQFKSDAFTYQRKNFETAIGNRLISVEPLHLAIVKVLLNETDRSNSDYYYVGDKYFEVIKGTMPGPEQADLSDSDKIAFQEKLPGRPISENQDATSQSMKDIAVNFGLLGSQLNRQGYVEEYFRTLEASMLKGEIKHEERYFSQFDKGAVIYNHLFNRNNDGNYSLDKITGTLYTHQDIDHLTINGIDTKKLEKEMLPVTWDIDGVKFIKQHEHIFRQLSEDSNGRLIAVQLFNNHVPLWWDRPDYISSIEDELRIYPKMDFSGETSSKQVYEGLKTYQEISLAMVRYMIPEAQDEESKAALIGKIVRGDPCSVFVPTSAKLANEVTINWDGPSKKLSFVMDGQDAEGYYLKLHSERYNSILNELQQYPFKQLDNPFKQERLIEGLLDGNKMPAHLEKELVPAEHIDCYVLIDRMYPDSEGHHIKPTELFSYGSLDTAIQEIRRIGDNYIYGESHGDFELMVVGQYKGKRLQYDREEMPTFNTGYLVATITNFSAEGYFFSLEGSVNRNNVLVEQLFVENDKETSKLVFSNKHGEAIEIDKDFWKKKEEQILLVKNRIDPNKGMRL